jgi:UDP-N-acetylglucosamine 3-dehydrogenase
LRASYITQDVYFVESTSGLAGWDELALVRGSAEGAMVRFALRNVEPLRAELEAFRDCVLEDRPEPVPAVDGIRVLAAAIALRESASRNEAVLLAAEEPVEA